ncbi:MAG: STAS domain-containing protein [bacterium]
MECAKSKEGVFMVIKVKGRLDSVTAPELDRECVKSIEQGETRLILDLGELDYLSSAGLRVILSTAKKLKSSQGTLSLCSLQEMVSEVFSVAGFSSFLPIFGSLEEALAQH